MKLNIKYLLQNPIVNDKIIRILLINGYFEAHSVNYKFILGLNNGMIKD